MKLLHPAVANDISTVIAKNGPDWRGRTPTRVPLSSGTFGEASYCYAPGSPQLGTAYGGEVWILVEALCGTSEQGQRGQRFPNNNPATNKPFESVVDNLGNRTAYGFFSFLQIYPLYALYF